LANFLSPIKLQLSVIEYEMKRVLLFVLQ